MPRTMISRRRFLAVAGAGLGATALTCSGLAGLDTRQAVVAFPEITIGESQMSEKILVAYASRTGSTAGVAEAIGRTLADHGVQVDVRRMTEVQELAPYRAVVAGSAVHGGAWLPEAMQFVQAHRAELVRKPFAVFLVCMTLAMPRGEQYRSHVGSWLDPVSAIVRPASKGLFAGALDCDKVASFGDRLKFRLSVAMGVWQAGDHRDWNAIRGWATELAPLLQA